MFLKITELMQRGTGERELSVQQQIKEILWKAVKTINNSKIYQDVEIDTLNNRFKCSEQSK